MLAAICAFWTIAVILLRFAPGIPFFSAVWTGQIAFEDLLRREGRSIPTKDNFVFLGMGESTLQIPPPTPEELASNRAFQLMTERSYPWSREVWVIFLDKLFNAGARLVIFDIVFGGTSETDPLFAAALDRYRDRVVLAANFDQTNASKHLLPNKSLIPDPQLEDDRVGYVNFWSGERDGKVRAAAYTVSDRELGGLPSFPGEARHQSLSARALQKLGLGDLVPKGPGGRLMRFTSVNAYAPKELFEVFDEKLWQANYRGGEFFKDKIVMVGASNQIQHDVVPTPLGEMHGPILHLHALAAAMDREFLRATPMRTNYALVAGAGILAWVLLAAVRRPIWALMSLVAAAGLYLAIARVAYDRAGLLILVVPVLGAFLLSGLFSLVYEFALERLEKLRTRRTLERYVSKNLVKEILDSPNSFFDTLKGVRKPATMLFSDIVGFTSLTETADPEKLVAQLNEYLTRMVAVVFKNDGTLDKFIGDAVMAVWGMARSVGIESDAKMAVCAALEMRRELAALNVKWKEEGFPPLGIGIGLNHGEVLAGNIGSAERADLTVIGDAVNLASRLEALTRTYHVDILVGASVCELVRDDFHIRSVGRVQVKGKSQPADIATVIGARNSKDVDPEMLKWLETYEQALAKFRARDFVEAKILFSRFLEFYPEDFLAKMYLDRALEYEQAPPDEAWNAVEVFTKK